MIKVYREKHACQFVRTSTGNNITIKRRGMHAALFQKGIIRHGGKILL